MMGFVMLMNIAPIERSPHPVLNLGFRIFFLSAAGFAIITMLMWYAILVGWLDFTASLNPVYWHGYQMLFGYALAVIAGFLLTAVKAWTGVPMPVGWRLFAIFLPWLIARILWIVVIAINNPLLILLAMATDVLFWLLVMVAVLQAVLIVRQKRQLGIVAKLVLLLLCQLTFAVGALSNQQEMQRLALYTALFVIVGVVFTIGRRVLPFFIEKGVAVLPDGTPSGTQAKLHNSLLVDRLSLFVFFGLMLAYLYDANSYLVSALAVGAAIINAVRLCWWHHVGIWQKPLLWSLYLAFWGMVLALLMIAILPWFGFGASLGLHALALTAIGMTTVAMMARVSLGHTGRNIHKPPKTVVLMFVLMMASFILRVFAPMVATDYLLVLGLSQLCWTGCSVLFLCAYAKILVSPRIDGLTG